MNSRTLPSAMVGRVSGLASVAHLSSSVSSLLPFDLVAEIRDSGEFRVPCAENFSIWSAKS